MEVIERVEILKNGQLILVLASGGNTSYQHIYREAAEVKWNSNLKAFTSPRPRDWSYSDWFHHIFKVAKNCNINLVTNNQTTWVNIPTDVKNEILAGNNT